MNNFVTITRVSGNEWEDIIPITREFLKSYISAGEKVVIETFERENLESEDPIISKIQEILETYIKPAVEVDGGQIIFKSFDEGKVTVELQGSCSGCPSSTITLKRGIEGMLTRMVPEVKEVVAL
jgi:Fe-S cluster biogenesis protein NfuA